MIEISIDTAPVSAYLRILSQKMADMSPVMRDIGEGILTQTNRAFESQKSPGGAAWKKLSQSTLLGRTGYGKGKKVFRKDGHLTQGARRKVSSAQILMDTARLRNSLTREVTPTSVTVGTNVPYAAIHQFGGQAGRGRKVSIPARPFLPDQASLDWEEITDTLTRYLSK